LKTKLVFALLTVVALGVLATGAVLAHTPTPTNTYSNNSYAPNSGYYGWVDGCYGYNQQYYYRYQPAPTPVPNPDSPEQPQRPLPSQKPVQPTNPGYYYPPQYPNQGYYPRYGRGCMGW
jgi:hypothetical protein